MSEQHGTRAAYRRGCKCDECRAANAAYANELRLRNPERNKALKLAWREKNREAEAARARRWHEDNPGKTVERIMQWRKNNRERHLANKRDRYALERTTGARQTGINYESLWTGSCGICTEPMDRGLPRGDRLSPTIDHIVPLAKGGSHELSNLQWAHMACNAGKGARV